MLDLSHCKTVDDVGKIGPMETPALEAALRQLGRPGDMFAAKMLAVTRTKVGSDDEAIERVRLCIARLSQ